MWDPPDEQELLVTLYKVDETCTFHAKWQNYLLELYNLVNKCVCNVRNCLLLLQETKGEGFDEKEYKFQVEDVRNDE